MNCLYNGVELPDIFKVYTAELQKTHPFAVITYFVGIYHLNLFTDNVFYCKDGGMLVKQDTTCLGSALDIENTKWGDFEESVYSVDGWGPIPLWSNFDILNEDGTLCLAASDPIPVNPAPTLDPTALRMGWQVGNKIARQRSKA